MAGKKWSLEENYILINNYNELETNKLLFLLSNRTWEACKIQACKLNLNRYYNKDRNHKLYKLLNDSLESYYWLGFIYADGCLKYKQKRLVISLSKKDINHLQKAAVFFETDINESKTFISITMADIKYFDQIVEKFKFKPQKTYNPPDNLSFLKTEEQFISFLIGFIDGDGCIRKQHNRNDATIAIKCHSSWFPIFIEFENKIYNILKISKKNSLSKINKNGYSFISFSNHKILNFLKTNAIEMNLPFMERKWSIIDLNKSYKNSFEDFRKDVLFLFQQGMKKGEIAKKLKVSNSYVSTVFHARK